MNHINRIWRNLNLTVRLTSKCQRLKLCQRRNISCLTHKQILFSRTEISKKHFLRFMLSMHTHEPMPCCNDNGECNDMVNTYTDRTHTCGALRISDIGRRVKLYGWVEYYRMNKFIVMRDAYGSTQVLIPDGFVDAKCMENISYESVVAVTGVVIHRPSGQENPKMPTGEIEVSAEHMTVLNYASSNIPFSIRDFNKAKEPLRMKYRYLSLRYPEMQKNLRMRATMLMKMREFLSNYRGFVEVETPTLFCRTPGGAQEFIVPTRKSGQFYSLVQSPQQFKQLLMVGGLDRYYQIARCYRDEGSRPDRQPEFTQLDIEMSFSHRDGILSLIEELLQYCWPESLGSFNIPFPRITYETAMDTYGTDKPDLRFDMKLINVDNIFPMNKLLQFRDFQSNTSIISRAVVFPGESENFTNSLKSKYEDVRKNEFPNCKLFASKITPTSKWDEHLQNLFSSSVVEDLREALKLQSNDVLFLAFGMKDHVQQLLGKLRIDFMNLLISKGLKHTDGFQFLWVVDFPLFVKTGEDETMESAHHPFTQPHPEDVHLLSQEPLKVRSLHYDLVLNGSEIGGGSIRIHDSELQLSVLRDFLKLNPSSLQHLLDALQSGCPPHGGIALGIDRLLCEMLGTVSIRDVIAFPKSYDGKDLMSGAPNTISEHDKKLYHLKIVDDHGHP